MSDEQDKLNLKIEQAEAAVARAQKLYDEAESAAAGVGDSHCWCFWDL